MIRRRTEFSAADKTEAAADSSKHTNLRKLGLVSQGALNLVVSYVNSASQKNAQKQKSVIAYRIP